MPLQFLARVPFIHCRGPEGALFTRVMGSRHSIQFAQVKPIFPDFFA